MYQIYLLSLFLFMLFTGDFKSEQLEYSRVKIAYVEKEKVVLDLLRKKNLSIENFQIFIRAFKEEKILEVWGKPQDQDTFTLLKEYSFCATSGGLGPKRQEGDQQIPEGFYHLNRFNPQSKYYLSLGINYPNQADRILGSKNNPGGDIFIHGDCVTIGCIPLTDNMIKEVYILAVEAHNNGQKFIPIHIYPSELNGKNVESLKKRYVSKPALLAFWSDLQKGFQYFEDHKKLPNISIMGTGRYKIDPHD